MAIKVRRGNKADLVVANLLAGEPVLALDTKEFGIKLADGTMLWVPSLDANGKVPYASLSGVASGTNGDADNALALGGVQASAIIDGSGNAKNALMLSGIAAAEYLRSVVSTFTPTLFGTTSSGSPTYESATGTYIKMNKMVFVIINLKLSNLGGVSGNMHIGGLPFAPVAPNVSFHIGYASGYSGTLSLTGYSSTSLGSIQLYKSVSGSYSPLTNTDVTNTFWVSGLCGYYMTA